CRQNRNWPFTF
nr:immunoglobulin light chain junction region [Macaca mulatta]